MRDRVPSLDGIRGIAILLVLFGHSESVGLGAGASAGVALFFALSGYLITSLLLAELRSTGRVSLRAFYIRRARRLLPALTSFLLALTVWSVLTGRISEAGPAVAAVAAYVANWAWISGLEMPGLAHAWSLSIEEQFYLLWPVLLLPLVRSQRAAALTAGAAILSFALAHLVGADTLRAFAGSDTRAVGLLAGCLVAFRSGALPTVRTPVVALAGLVLLLIAMTAVGSGTLVVLPATIVLIWATQNPGILSARWLTGTGRISYAIYLWHYPFIYGGPWAIFDELPAVIRLACVILVPCLIAVASWFLLERRFLRPRISAQVPDRLQA